MSIKVGNTLDYLEAGARTTPEKLVLRKLLFTKTHDQWTALVEDAIDYISKDFAETAHHRKDRDEDGITIDIVTSLKNMGFQASHDEDVGGHCDIVVRGDNDFVWLAEAKIHDAYDWLLKGFEQISTRYTTGFPGQNSGALIIYCKAPNAAQIMKRWIEVFSAKVPGIHTVGCDKFALAYISTFEHERSGLPFRLRHIPFTLWHAPKDRR